MTARTAVLVLGMHRSGTSALTRVLSFLGASLPRHLYPPGLGNETGHWEPEAAVHLHDRILGAAGTSVNDLYGPPESWFRTRAAEAFADEIRSLVDTEFGDDPLFVIKDPRTALIFPMWRRALASMNIRCLAVIIARNPVEVALSLAERQNRAVPSESWALDRGGLLWLRYNLAAERYTRGMARSFCRYSELLDDWRSVAHRLAGDLGLSWPRPVDEGGPDIDGFLSSSLRHHREPDCVSDRSGIWSSWIAPVYTALCRAGDGQEPDRAVFGAVGRSIEAAFGGLWSMPFEKTDANRPSVPVTAAPVWHAGWRRLCLVGSALLTGSDGAERLRSIVAAAADASFDVTIVDVDGSGPSAAGLEEIAARYGLELQHCDSRGPAIEPAYLRPTIALFRHLRTRPFGVILFQDCDGLGHASIVAKRTGMAFGDTVLGVVAVGSAGKRREDQHLFPSSLVAIATEYVERRAIELADVVVLPSDEVAQWMLRKGWHLGTTLSLPERTEAAPPSAANAWAGVLQSIAAAERQPVAPPAEAVGPGDVTVVITHFEQPRLLDQNLEALSKQTDAAFSVLVVDDGSRSEEALGYLAEIKDRHPMLNLRLLRQDNRYLGAARNAGIRAAETEFVILLDDDNVAFPDMVKTLRRAIHTTDAAVVTCAIRHFHDTTGRPGVDMAAIGPDQFFPTGPVLLGVVHNCFGDASGIYRKSVFAQVGYFHERHGVTFEDWQMHLRVVAAGLRLFSLPEPLVWYRIRPDSMLRRTRRFDNARVIASAVQNMPCSLLEPLADYLMGSEMEQVRLNGEVARLAAVDRRDEEALRVVTATQMAVLVEAAAEARRHARNLQDILDERTRSANESERYARSLEHALAELRASHDAASQYAASLERSRTEIEAYARQLETELATRRRGR